MDSPQSDADANAAESPDESRSPQKPVLSKTATKTRKTIWLKRIILWLGIPYLAIIILLVTNETSLVYPVSKYPRGRWEPSFQFEEVTFESADGTKLGGWFLAAERKKRTILLCHGNAENVSQASDFMGHTLRVTMDADVFVFDYRGYGKSEGTPFEKGVLEDTEAAMRWLNKKTGTTPEETIIVGHSLGGGPAVHIASTMGAKALVLQRTYNSLAKAAQNLYWWVPVQYLVRNRFESDKKIVNCPMPLFQSHGDQDEVIHIDLAKDLFEKSPAEKKQFFIAQGMSHYEYLPSNYWTELKEFLESID